jgi:hypothetical protein
MTLQRTDAERKGRPHSIQVLTEVVSVGQDGIGFRFVLPESESLSGEETNKKALENFLRRLRLS